MIKFKKKKIILYVLFIISLVGVIISFIYFFNYNLYEKKTNNQLNYIQDITEVDISNSDESDLVNVENNNDTNDDDNNNKIDNYYVNFDLINVSFDKLKEINNDTMGWIMVPGTKINYPFVQGNDNEYYLRHSFDKSYNRGGWVFLDYRNDLTSFNEKNIILYAHNMRNKTMFGTLKNILSDGWLENKDNHVIKLSTEYENTLWQVFSIYHIPVTSDYIKTKFKDSTEFDNFTQMILDRSIYNFDTLVNTNDKIITLSTCYSKNERLVLHAKLIKRETK